MEETVGLPPALSVPAAGVVGASGELVDEDEADDAADGGLED